MIEKLAHNTLINILADAHEQDVSWLHANIGFGRLMFRKALRCKEMGYQPSIAIERIPWSHHNRITADDHTITNSSQQR